MKRLFAVCALSLALAGCQTLGGWWDDWFGSSNTKNAPSPLLDFKPSLGLKVRATAAIGGAGGTVFTPALSGDAVFAASYEGKLARFDANSLKEVWRVDTGKKLSSGVGLGPQLILLGTPKGEVLAYDFSGKSIWTARVSSEVLSAPQVAGELVIVRSGDGRIFGLDAKDGKRKWFYQRATPALTVRSFGGVAVDKNAIFAGFGGGKLVALDTDSGNLGWEATVSQPRGVSELERIADITSNPVTDGNAVCAAAFQGRTACFENQNANPIWARDVSSIAGLAMDARNVYIADDKGAVIALDKSSGASVWKQDKLTNRQLSTPLVYRGYVVVGDVQGYVHFLSREDGSFAGRIATDGSPIRAQAQPLTDGILVQTKKGGLFVLGFQ